MKDFYSARKKQDAIIQAFKDQDEDALFNHTLDSIVHLFRDKPIPFQTYIRKYISDKLDEFSRDTENKTGGRYLGGILTLRLEDDSWVLMEAKQYYKKSEGRIFCETRKGRVEARRFDEWGSCQELIDLEEKGEISYQLEPTKSEKNGMSYQR